jgi:hypothetical protein
MSALQPKKEKSIEDLVVEIRTLLHDEQSLRNRFNKKRLDAGRRLLELRARVEAGEAGSISWWAFYDQNLLSLRSRGDAEKIMAVASAENPDSAAEEAARRNREYQAKHRAKRAAYVSGAEGVKPEAGAPEADPIAQLTRVRDQLKGIKVSPDDLAKAGNRIEAQQLVMSIFGLASDLVDKFTFAPRGARRPRQGADPEQLVTKLTKVVALATRGATGGEKAAAMAAANRLLVPLGLRIGPDTPAEEKVCADCHGTGTITGAKTGLTVDCRKCRKQAAA